MTIVNFRADEAAERLLAELARPGENRSETIRRALQDAATLARRERMRAESLACRADDADVAEARASLADLAGLRAW